ncbi:3-phosphoshikimate 1-carboxyvinyltransferase [Roseivirga misakiensis]|uniref:3-phosphoshikimate 1-carboxyvinyltransferase n=1 Tax=Roseivirga misakiensis TaxID=1563681 RepID=A0A1E5SKF0_9BACT|nr:3-phosphoshikimate 1-carboxyvinyltransferase [Roseivirga misakiensis]OEJ99614.1 3-phosphoshikimate 1-carboxyvinyltransferase [Roseivirga misakiensis]
MESIALKHCPKLNAVTIPLEASKSESNRALIINALSGNTSAISNLSNARDTQTMLRLLTSNEETLDVLDAGTTMRFLTAYSALGKNPRVLTGTPRMQKRPIKILGKALKQIGAKVKYLKNDGYPPMKITPIKDQKKERIRMKGDVSSQFISAILMIAPALPEGLILELIGKIGSRPYIQMTLDMMKLFGIQSSWTNNTIEVKPQPYQSYPYQVESDWSGASYWFSFAALAESAEIKLLGLRQKSLQGDIAIVRIMNQLGVMSTFEADGVLLQKIPARNEVEIDFSDCPDLAQTVAVVCGVKHISCKMTGLESLRIKETDRIKALKRELKKFNIKLKETEEGVWEIKSKFQPGQPEVTIETYEDHRMAMAFAPLSTQQDILIKDPSVVDKSYPSFWNHVGLATGS